MNRLAWKLAWRNLRGGWRSFRLAVLALALGVATIAGVGSFGSGLVESLRENGRVILGGDIAVRTTMMTPTTEQIEWLEGRGELSRSADVFAMAIASGRDPMLVNLRAVDEHWPLYGEAVIEPAVTIGSALGSGAIVDRDFLERTGLVIGSTFSLGNAEFTVSALLVDEPDRASAPFQLGPRVILSLDALEEAGVAGPGSLVRHLTRLRLDDGPRPADVVADLKRTFPDARWRVRSHDDANPQLRRFLERLSMFITLVGLTALLVGGIGIFSAVSTYLARQVPTIATLKSLGASARLVFTIYLLEITIMACLGVGLGLVAGILLPSLVGDLAGDALPVPVRPGIHAGPLVLSAAYGFLVALLFALPALARTRDVPPGALFRALGPAGKAMRCRDMAAVASIAVLVAAIAIVTTDDHRFAAIFVAAAVVVLLLFRLAGQGFMRLARAVGRPSLLALRMALANLHRQGAPTVSVTVAFGIGLTVLTVVAGVEANLRHELGVTIARKAPAFFVIDVQPDQIGPFLETVEARQDVSSVQSAPSMRGRVVAIDGVPVGEAVISPDARWSVNGDVGVTYSATAPGNAEIVAGEWWAEDYAGPPLLSFDANLAAGYGIGIGDTLVVNVIGREITATIANLRKIDWTSLGMNFVLVYSPGLLETAPHSHIATVYADAGAENPLRRELAGRFPNISVISVRNVLDDIMEVLGSVDAAVGGIAALALVAGLIVIAESVVAAQRRRLHDAVVLKVLGATRPLIMTTFTLEHLILGLAAALPAMLAGTAASWAVVFFVLDLAWTMPWMATLALALLALSVSLAAGLVTGWYTLSFPAAPVLRAE